MMTKRFLATLIVTPLFYIWPLVCFADGANEFLEKPPTPALKKVVVNPLNIEAKNMIEKYWTSVMTKCGDDYYYPITDESNENGANDDSSLVLNGISGEMIAIAHVRLRSKEKVEGITGSELSDAGRLNGYMWVGSAYHDKVVMRVYVIKNNYNLMSYVESGDGDFKEWLNKWTSWNEVDLIGANVIYAPWATVHFFKKSGSWYIGDPDNVDEAPQLMSSIIEKDSSLALKCSDIPKEN